VQRTGARADHREKLLYLLVGGWNTLFGYGLYAGLVWVFGRDAYWWLLVPTSLIAVTQNYVAYKFIVFRTKGSWIREYAKFWLVYLPYLGLNLLVLPGLVSFLGLDPRIAQAAFVMVAFVITYFAHKHFTFRDADDAFSGAKDPTPPTP